jgi:capsular polysaccharide biosynthesis protein
LHNVQLNDKGNDKAWHTDGRYTHSMRLDPNLEDSFTKASSEEYVLPLKDLLGVLWRRMWIVLIVAALLAGAALTFDLLRTPIYESSIRLLVGQEEQSTDFQSGNLGNDVQGLQQMTQTMSSAVVTRPVVENAIAKLGLELSPEDILPNLSANQENTTQFIEVSYRDSSPERAQQVANTIGEIFSGEVSNISRSANGVTVMVWEQATLPESPSSPKLLRDVVLALVLGGMLGIGLAFLLEYLDDRWRSPEEVEQVSGVPTFGIIPEIKVSKSKKGGD